MIDHNQEAAEHYLGDVLEMGRSLSFKLKEKICRVSEIVILHIFHYLKIIENFVIFKMIMKYFCNKCIYLFSKKLYTKGELKFNNI